MISFKNENGYGLISKIRKLEKINNTKRDVTVSDN